ncbi:MAG: DUF4843 domain-containing protein [Odoribacter sp.]|nr:DUF4843 domain-containing protein [Odoribacter sp.]
MRKYIYLMLLSGMLACQEDDLVQYVQDKDALQFSRSFERSKSFNFATAYETRNDEAYYWGDSLAETKMQVVLQLQGFPTPDERPYKLKTVFVEGQDSSKVAEVRFEPYYSLAPNQLLDTIEFTVLRPKTRGNFTVGIAVNTDGDDAFFEKGAEECAVYELKIADRYDEPLDWRYREEWLGEFDPEKYAFMVTVSNKLFHRSDYDMWNRTDLYNAFLRSELEKFNASVPEEEQKQFTFPNMPKWTWWDNRTSLLGEFSMEKYAFMQEMLETYGSKEEQFLENSKLEWWNLLFREVLAEEPREGVEFPRNTERSSWWRESILEDWSLEKQEFVVLKLFPKSKNYQIGETTWDYAAPVLRRCVDRYNLEHPENLLNYTFKDEGKPEWWDAFVHLFGPYSSVKRDIVVEVVLNRGIPWSYDINSLKDGNANAIQYQMDAILAEVATYNTAHPGQEITDFPKTPAWWDTKLLGEYSEEKEEYMNYVIAEFEGGQWWTNQIQEHWATVFRCCVDWYNQKTGKTLLNDFPVTNGKWNYWNNYTDVWGKEYSDAKKTFVLWVLFREIPGFGDYWEYTKPKADAKTLLINALNKYNEDNDPDLPFDFN